MKKVLLSSISLANGNPTQDCEYYLVSRFPKVHLKDPFPDFYVQRDSLEIFFLLFKYTDRRSSFAERA